MEFFKEMWSEMTNWERVGFVLGIPFGVIVLFAFMWCVPIACVVAGGSIEVCGL